MPQLKVLKGLRLTQGSDAFKKLPTDPETGLVRAGDLPGAVYIEGDVVNPNGMEARALLELFPEHFELVQ